MGHINEASIDATIASLKADIEALERAKQVMRRLAPEAQNESVGTATTPKATASTQEQRALPADGVKLVKPRHGSLPERALAYMKTADGPQTVREVADALGFGSMPTMRNALVRLAQGGRLKRIDDGKYVVATESRGGAQ